MNKWYSQDSDKELNDDQIHIWVSYLNVHQARLKHLYPLLTDEEKERSERFKFYKHRKAFIASHGFLHTTLSHYLNTEMGEIEFSYNQHGKPGIIESQNPQQIQFNLSHSGHLAILAVCKNHNLGIDIEFKDRKSDWQGIIRRFFTQNEQNAIFDLPEDKQKDAFFQMWTRKEAHMKITGLGLSLAPNQFEVSTPPTEPKFLGNLKEDDNNFYKMQEIQLPEMHKDYTACLSSDFDFKSLVHYIQQ